MTATLDSSEVKRKPKAIESELDRMQKKFEEFESQIKELTLDRMSEAPLADHDPQTKLSQKQLEKSKDIYLKPERLISVQDKFNEKYREDFNFQKEYVQFIAEHKELIGEVIEIWTKPFAGVPAEYWKVPTGKPIWGPRYLAEQIRKARYHRLRMDESKSTSSDGTGTFYGSMIVDNTVPRLTAEPVSTNKSIFMGKTSGF